MTSVLLIPSPVRRYLISPEAIRSKPRTRRSSKLDPYREYVYRRRAEGQENCVVLHRELKGMECERGYSIKKSCVSPRRDADNRTPASASRRHPVSGPWLTGASLAYFDKDGGKRPIKTRIPLWRGAII